MHAFYHAIMRPALLPYVCHVLHACAWSPCTAPPLPAHTGPIDGEPPFLPTCLRTACPTNHLSCFPSIGSRVSVPSSLFPIRPLSFHHRAWLYRPPLSCPALPTRTSSTSTSCECTFHAMCPVLLNGPRDTEITRTRLLLVSCRCLQTRCVSAGCMAPCLRRGSALSGLVSA